MQPQKQNQATPQANNAQNAVSMRQHLGYSLALLIAVEVLITASNAYLPAVAFNLFVVAYLAVVVWLSISAKNQLQKQITRESTKKAATALGLGVLVAQAILHYSLKNSNPKLASQINSLGWKVLGSALVIYFALGIVAGALGAAG